MMYALTPPLAAARNTMAALRRKEADMLPDVVVAAKPAQRATGGQGDGDGAGVSVSGDYRISVAPIALTNAAAPSLL